MTIPDEVERTEREPTDAELADDLRTIAGELCDEYGPKVRLAAQRLEAKPPSAERKMTPRQIELARHALGLVGGRCLSFRNHFVCGPGHVDYDDWQAMAADGMAKRRAGSPLTGGDDFYYLTRDGAEAALKPGERLDPENFPKAATLSGKEE